VSRLHHTSLQLPRGRLLSRTYHIRHSSPTAHPPCEGEHVKRNTHISAHSRPIRCKRILKRTPPDLSISRSLALHSLALSLSRSLALLSFALSRSRSPAPRLTSGPTCTCHPHSKCDTPQYIHARPYLMCARRDASNKGGRRCGGDKECDGLPPHARTRYESARGDLRRHL